MDRPTGQRRRAAAASIERLPAGTLLAFRYALGEAVGGRGPVEVHAATDQRTGGPVLAKLVRPARVPDVGPVAALRLAEEAEWFRTVTHAGIPRFVADGWDDPTGARFLVLDAPHGSTLAARLESDPPLGAPAALRIAGALCETVAAIHRLGLVHLALDPSAVFLPYSETEYPTKLLDLWLHRAGGRAPAPGPLDARAEFLAPERRRDEPVDARADTYSLGVMVDRILAATAAAGMLDPVLDTARRYVEDNPAARPPTVADLIAAIEGAKTTSNS